MAGVQCRRSESWRSLMSAGNGRLKCRRSVNALTGKSSGSGATSRRWKRRRLRDSRNTPEARGSRCGHFSATAAGHPVVKTRSIQPQIRQRQAVLSGNQFRIHQAFAKPQIKLVSGIIVFITQPERDFVQVKHGGETLLSAVKLISMMPSFRLLALRVSRMRSGCSQISRASVKWQATEETILS